MISHTITPPPPLRQAYGNESKSLKNCREDRRRSLSYWHYTCFLKWIWKFLLVFMALEWFLEQWDYLVFEGLVGFLCETIEPGASRQFLNNTVLGDWPVEAVFTGVMFCNIYFPRKLFISFRFSNVFA